MYSRAKARRSSKTMVFHAPMNRSISHSLLLVRLFHSRRKHSGRCEWRALTLLRVRQCPRLSFPSTCPPKRKQSERDDIRSRRASVSFNLSLSRKKATGHRVYSSTLLWLIGDCCPLNEGKTGGFRNSTGYRWCNKRKDIIGRDLKLRT